jgi:S-DNA-T family DNA segregation ATPase FtsK/SpoIIIE
VLIDRWDAVCAALPDAESAACTDRLLGLLRSAAPAGFAFVLAGDGALATGKAATAFAERLLLGAPDGRQPLSGLPAHPSSRPPDPAPGRGRRSSDGALVQLALPPDLPARDGAGTAGRSRRVRPIVVRPLPDHVRLADMPRDRTGRIALGLAGDEADPVLVDPFTGPRRWLVAGPPRSGRTTALRLIARQAQAQELALLVVAPDHSPLLLEAAELAVPVLRPGDPAELPAAGTLVLVDDCEAFTGTVVGDALVEWARRSTSALLLVVAGRTDDVATSYRGVAAEVRRHRCGILLRPGPLDGELLGVRLARRTAAVDPPGRGVAVADASWGAAFAGDAPVPIQLADPDESDQPNGPPMCG